MKKLLLLLIIPLISFSAEAQQTENETTTFYLIRHAEKDRSDAENRNPSLTEEGFERAQKWAQVFKDAGVQTVYSTDYNRTKQTAMPTAKLTGEGIIFYDPRNLNLEKLKKDNLGKTVLIVGHSNTTPMLANALLGDQKYKQMSDTDNGGLYMVTLLADGNTLSTLLHVD